MSMATDRQAAPQRLEVELLADYGFEGVRVVGGVAFDGEALWCGDFTHQRLMRVDPESGRVLRTLEGIEVRGGTAFDGACLWQVGDGKLLRIDPETGRVVATLPQPAEGFISGLAWADGVLWVGHYESRRIFKLDPATGRVLATIRTDRFVTGIAWVDDELWHGTTVMGGGPPNAELRRVDPATGVPLAHVPLPGDAACAGVAIDAADRWWCGDCNSGRLRAFSPRRKGGRR